MNELRERVLAYLAQHRVLTLATCANNGVWAAAVFYASVDLNLYFLSAPHTRHARDMAANPQVAGTIQEDYAQWLAIKGIQLEGTVKRLAGAAQEEAITQYLAKYPFIAEGDGDLVKALERSGWYRLTPSRLYFIDNSRGLGHRDELQIE
ncbi:MAG: pyridoxamine 5'-phosphate oxidase family protein [Candidatus Promineifilaceae bacterium]